VQGLAVCIAGMRNQHGQCPKEVMQFLLDLFKYNDNQYNKVSWDALIFLILGVVLSGLFNLIIPNLL